MSGQDKRRDPRVDTNQAVWVEGQDVRVEAEARNMSKSGMFVVAPANAPQVGTTLEIKFEDPHEGQIALKMEVVWRDEKSENSKLGLRALDSAGMAAFERVVTRYLDSSDQGSNGQEKADEKDPKKR